MNYVVSKKKIEHANFFKLRLSLFFLHFLDLHYLLFTLWIPNCFNLHIGIIFKPFFHFYHNYIIHINFTSFIATIFVLKILIHW